MFQVSKPAVGKYPAGYVSYILTIVSSESVSSHATTLRPEFLSRLQGDTLWAIFLVP